MINPFKIGDTLEYKHLVTKDDLAQFKSGTVHEVYSTFALGRDAEWCCRQFVLQMMEGHEQGIGTYLHINHKSPALNGSLVRFMATLINVDYNNVICTFKAHVGDRLIAEGEQGQKILTKKRLTYLFESLK